MDGVIATVAEVPSSLASVTSSAVVESGSNEFTVIDVLLTATSFWYVPAATLLTCATKVRVAAPPGGIVKPVHVGCVSPGVGDVAAAAPVSEVVLAYEKPDARVSVMPTFSAAAVGL
jgi:hypothetical protein